MLKVLIGVVMTIFRTEHKNNYTVVNNFICKDNRLSWKAKGIWLYAFSRPDDWSFNMADLIKQSTDGRDAVRAGLNELTACGYLCRSQKREGGQFSDAEWVFYEMPSHKEKITSAENPSAVNTTAPKLITANHPLLSIDSLPSIEKEINIDIVGAVAPVVSADAERLHNLLLKKLNEINTKRKPLTEKETEAWIKTMDLIIRVDKRSLQDLQELIEWFPTNSFWVQPIQSPTSLRKHFDKMYSQMNPPVTNEETNRKFVQMLMKEYAQDLKHIKIYKTYVLDPINQKDLYFANHPPEQFKKLFLDLAGGEEI